jgi:hypothetical protein
VRNTDVPVLELLAESLEGLDGDCGLGGEVAVGKHVVPHLVGELLGLDASWTGDGAVEAAGLEQVGDGVVGHVDCRIGE